MVTTQEVLEQLDLPNLKKIARRLGIQISKGFTGFLMEQGIGIETRRPYIDALTNSGLVTLEEIDRILKTHYSRLQNEAERVPRFPRRAPLRRSRVSERDEPRDKSATSFQTYESAAQFILEYLSKDGLQIICDDLDMPISGTKEDLVFRILGDSDFTPEMALAYVDKYGLKEICEQLGLRTQGLREELEQRIRRAIPARPPAQPTSSSYPRLAQDRRAQPAPTAPPPAHPQQPAPQQPRATLPRAPRPKEMFCPLCGTHYPSGTQFCSKDATALREAA